MNINRLLLSVSLSLSSAALMGQGLDPALLLKPATDAWPTYNGDYSGRRFSPLDQINASNVKTLSLAWIYRANISTFGAIVGGEGPETPAAAGGGFGGG